MVPVPKRFDVFCRVVDNFGDAGVALRLARQLAAEHGADVALHVDDLRSLALIAPSLDAQRDEQCCEGVRVRTLEDLRPVPAGEIPDVVVEAFGCRLPEPYLDAMERAARPPVWINLEYLSAEGWIERTHGLPSPHPQRALKRWFFFPGFSAATGGLLRERGLLAQREQWCADPAARRDAWTSLGFPPPRDDALVVSLFCYPNPALPALLAGWRDGDAPVACIVPQGVVASALDPLFAGDVPRAGEVRIAGALTLAVAPFVDQAAFDRRLWTSDVNFVRGEDSFVRAQWAARPLVWHIYPQDERAHVAKLRAFVDLYAAGIEAGAADALRAFWEAFNAGNAGSIDRAWRSFRLALPSLAVHALHWAKRLGAQLDLASQLVDFARVRL